MSKKFWTEISRDNRVAYVNGEEMFWAIRRRGELWRIYPVVIGGTLAEGLTTRQVTAWRPAP